jgi:hypothetical protein
MVWMGDSMTTVAGSPSPDTSGADWTRLGDRFARALCTRGALRFAQGYFTDATATSSYPRGCLRNGTTAAEATIHSGTYPDRDDLRANCQALAATYDVVYHQLAGPGDNASEYQSDATFLTIGSDGGDPIDWLFVQFVTNDVAEAESTSTFQANLELLLETWTNVKRKFVLLAWAWDGSGGRTYPNDAISRSAYHTAAVNAAGAVTAGGGAGHFQSTIPVVNVGWSGQGLQAYPGSATTLSNDGVHLNQAGVEMYLARWGRWAELGVMRP